MKTLQKTIILLLFGITTLYLPAQTSTESSFIAQKKHSIGLNLYPIIAHLTKTDALLPGLVPFEITYKHQLTGKSRAWRFGLLGQYNDTYQDGNLVQPYDDSFRSIDYETAQKRFQVGAYTGHEWQWALGKRWLLAIGADVRYLYEHRNQWDTQTSSGAHMLESYGKYYSHGVSLQPFAGIHFAITSHWLLYTDFKVDFTYNYTTTKNKDSRQVPITTQSTNTSNFKFNQLTFQGIRIIYSF